MWYKNTRVQNLFVLLVFTVGILGSLYLLQLKKDLTNEEKLEVERIVFSHLFENNNSQARNSSHYKFIGVSNSDPSQKLLESFSDHVPKVKPLSNAKIPTEWGIPVTLREDSTKSGVVFKINYITKRLDGKIYIEASYFEAYMSSASYTYLLESSNGGYRIISFELSVIS